MGMMSHSCVHVWLTDIIPTIVVSKEAVTPICAERGEINKEKKSLVKV